ncbi:uncharacterized protein LOC136007529 isoform X2 [Lathamus discolor]
MDGIACGFDRDVKSKEQQCPCAAVCATRGSSASTLVSYTTSAPCFFSSRCSTALALCFKAATASFRMRIMNSFCSQRHLKEKTVFRRDFIQSVKKDLSTMVSNLPDENKLPLSKITSFKGFQTMPAPPGTEMQQDAAGFTSAALEKEPEWQTKETSWQELKMWLEEKEKDLIKEKSKISQEKRLVMQQDKILEDMQIKISHLEEQLKHPELIGLPQEKKVENCPCFLTLKIQKSVTSYLRKISLYLGICLWLLDRLLLHTGRLCVTLALFSKHVPDPAWVNGILSRIFHQYNRSYLWPH